MGQLSTKNTESCFKNKQSALVFFLNLFLFIFVSYLFMWCLLWLLAGIEHYNIHQYAYVNLDYGQVGLSAVESPYLGFFGDITWPSVVTGFVGLVGVKIGNNIIDFCWLILKSRMIKIWNRIVRHWC